jgi:hypothetical protein
MMNTKQDNTTALLSYYAARRAEAEAKPDKLDRDIALKSNNDAEWYVLHACLTVPHLYAMHDGMPIAQRLDAIRAEMLADYDARREAREKEGK